MSKNKLSSNTDNKDTNSLEEENVKIEPKKHTDEVNVDDNGIENISIEETIENQIKEIKDLKDQLLRSLAEGENLRTKVGNLIREADERKGRVSAPRWEAVRAKFAAEHERSHRLSP